MSRRLPCRARAVRQWTSSTLSPKKGQIKKHGAKRIKFIGLIAAPEGIEALHKAHPDVDIYLGAKDDHLNENGYIVPGLGDAGDRIYGTK